MKNRIIFTLIVFFILPVISYSQSTADLFIENLTVNGTKFSFEVHITPTNDWGTILDDALGDCSWYFDYNENALNNPQITFIANEVSAANGYTSTTGLVLDKVQITTDLNFPTSFGVPLTVGTKYHLYTLQMDIINSEQTSDLSWDQINTGVFTAVDGEIVESYYGGGNAPLPVELSSFTVRLLNNKIELNWQTATEVDNYGFEIQCKSNLRGQQSVNDNSDLEGYTKVGFVHGAGNSNSPKEYSFTDKNPVGGNKFVYRLKQIDTDGSFSYSDEIEVDFVPEEFELFQNYPNPFNPLTNIKFSVPAATDLKLVLYNLLGEKVKTIIEGNYEPGFYEVKLNASDLSAGIYIYRIESKAFAKAKKLLLLK